MNQDLRQMMTMMQSENGIAKMLQDPGYEVESGGTVSQAELITDLINIMRMDVKALADAHDVDISTEQMTEEKCAEMIQGLVRGQSLDLVETFNQIEQQREEVLKAVLDDEEFENHLRVKDAYTSAAAEYDLPEAEEGEREEVEDDESDEE